MDLKFYTNFLVISLIIIKSVGCVEYHYYAEANSTFCNFFDTINITGGTKNITDNSITFNNVRYKPQDYGIFNYIYLPNQIKVDVVPHVRGCVCKYKNCVRLCCPHGHSSYDYEINKQLRQICVHNDELNSIKRNYSHKGEQSEIDLMNHHNITLVTEKPCNTGYFLDPDEPLDEWTVLSNGSLVVGDTNSSVIVNHDQYCIAHVYDKHTGEFHVKALYCTDDTESAQMSGFLIYPTVMVVSIVFLSLTLFVYIWIEELRRTIHGKNFMCYIATLIVGYSFLAFTLIDRTLVYTGYIKCLIISQIIHTAFICSFIWLSIISFDIWRTIGRTDNYRNQFLNYCVFACVLTVVIVGITNLLDNVEWLSEDYRPGFATKQCWLQDKKYAHFLYLYSLIIIVITINTVFFILTKLKIEYVKRISARATSGEGSRKFSREETDADRFGLFLRLFMIMGIPWIIEIISWLADKDGIFTIILDITTMLQGPFIFFLFIKKRRVKKLIKRKLSTMSFRSNTVNRNSGIGGNSSSGVTTVTMTSGSIKLDNIKKNHGH